MEDQLPDMEARYEYIE